MDKLLEKLLARYASQGQGLDLTHWLFRQICFAVAFLCLFVILPLGLIETGLPVLLNMADIGFGLFALFCFTESQKGRHRIALFLSALIVVLNVTWFFDGGTSGSTNFYFFGAEFMPVIFFRGRPRWAVVGLILLNACTLNVIGFYSPGLVTTFHSGSEQILDVVIGLFCAFTIIAVVIWVLVTSHDFERKRLAQVARHLEASEEKFSKAFRSVPNGMGIAELETGRFVEVNDGFCRIYGLSRAEAIGRTSMELGLWKSPEERELFVQRLRSAGSLRDVELLKHTRAGVAKLILLNAEIVEIAGVKCVISMIQDITERKEADVRLRNSEEQYGRLFEHMIGGFVLLEVICDQDGKPVDHRLLQVNSAFEQMTGLKRSEEMGRTSAELSFKWPPEVAQRYYQVALGGVPLQWERFNDSLQRHFDVRAYSPRRGQFAMIFYDITEQKRAARKEVESLALLRATLESTNDGLLTVGKDGKIISFNQQFVKMWRIPAEILATKDDRLALDFVLDQLKMPEQFLTKVQHLYQHPAEESFDTLEFKDRRFFERYSSPMLVDGQPTGRVWSFRDVTQRKQTESVAGDQKRVLEMIATDAPIHEIFESLIRVVEANGDGMLCSILLLDSDGRHLRHGAAPSLPEAFVKAADGIPVGENMGSCGTAASRRQPVFVEDIATDPLWEAAKDLALSHGLRACWSTPIFDAQQNVLGTFAMYYRQPGLPDARHRQLIDLATHTAVIAIGRERAKAALQNSEAKLLQSQKMEAIGQLAGGVAHDFNNILSALLMQTELLIALEHLPEEARKGLEEIRKDVNRATELTRQLLLFSRRQVMQPRLLNLNDLILNLGKMLQRIIREDVQLQLHLHASSPTARADAGMIEQILVNLVVNACDAMPGGGCLRIDTLEMTLDAHNAGLYPDAQPGRYAGFGVGDTGGGIPPEILPHIFEPFYTTKEPGRGTGLGLATVFGIVKQHHGWIKVDNHPGRGVTFQIFLPASIATGPDSATAEAMPRPCGGTETILLVEDDEAVRKLVQRILVRHGYKVLEAANGLDALELWQDNRDGISLLLTDLVMPGGLSGQELGRRLRTDKPGLKTVFASGYSPDIAGKEFNLLPGEIFLQKPFAFDSLLEKIRVLLDA